MKAVISSTLTIAKSYLLHIGINVWKIYCKSQARINLKLGLIVRTCKKLS